MLIETVSLMFVFILNLLMILAVIIRYMVSHSLHGTNIFSIAALICIFRLSILSWNGEDKYGKKYVCNLKI